VDPGDCPEVKRQELVSDDRYRQLREKYAKLRCAMGAEAIKELLKRVDIENLSVELREKMKSDASAQVRKNTAPSAHGAGMSKKRSISRCIWPASLPA